MKRVLLITLLSVGLACILLSGAVFAQEKYPSKPISLTVGYRAGCTTDLTARALAEGASKYLGQKIVVSNKPGGSATVALVSVKAQKPDGYNLCVMGSTQVRNQYMRDVPYSLERDFTPVIHYMSYHFGLVVRADSPWKTLKEFLDYAKANPGKIVYGFSALGTPQHFIMERLTWAEDIQWRKIPFGGGLHAVMALLGGHIEAVSQGPDWVPYVDAGQLRLLATYGKKRMPKYPNVPTLIELGYNFTEPGFNAMVAPKGISPEKLNILAKAFKKVCDDPESEFNKVMNKFGLPVDYKSPEEFAKYLKEFDKECQVVIRKAGLWKKKK
jgi:tripartite-type tricarboxylate transporter receptor subunit TctC